jgi:hypothetical protein
LGYVTLPERTSAVNKAFGAAMTARVGLRDGFLTTDLIDVAYRDSFHGATPG